MRFGTYVLAMALLTPAPLFAQRTAATLSGTVTDSSGAVMPQATVIATEISTRTAARTESNDGGFYVLAGLAPGNYQVQVEKPGYEKYIQEGVVLEVALTTSVNVQLRVGSVSQSVVVTGQGGQVNLSSPTQSYEITAQMSQQLPLDGRNVLQLTQLAPDATLGNSTIFAQGFTRPESQVFTSASGGQGNTTAYYLDGGLNQDPYTNVANIFPNPDSLQEFSYETNTYSAKFGGSGGGVMNAETRGGTNQFHGALFEFLRNGPIFDAKNYFSTTSDLLKWNQFGGAVGGPVRKDKTFFFFSYQGLRERVSPSGNSTAAATPAELNGDWSAITKQLVNPSTGLPFPDNQIPVSSYNPITLKIMDLIPVASPTTGLAKYTVRSESNDNQYIARVDHKIGDKLSLFGSYLFDQLNVPSTQDPTDLLSASPNSQYRSQHVTVSGTYALHPNLLANFMTSFTRDTTNQTGAPGFPDWPSLGVDIPTLAQHGSQTAFWGGVSGYFSWGFNAAVRVPRQSYDFATNWTWIKGNHLLEYGAEVSREASTIDQDFLSDGYFSWGGSLSGNNLVDFMLGASPSVFEQFAPYYESVRRTLPAIYVNDSWKPIRRLTLSLGIRWEPWLPLSDIHGQQSLFNPAAYALGVQSQRYPNLPPGYLVSGDPGVPAGGISSSYTVFDPRIGFAYDLFGNGATSVRAGFGIYHDQVMGVSYNNQGDQPPFEITASGSYPSNFAEPYQTIPNPFPAPYPIPSDYKFTLPFTATPYYAGSKYPTTQQWNSTVDQQLPAQTLLRVSYQGARSYHMPGAIQGNAGIYNPELSYAENETTLQQRRPMAQYFTSLPFGKFIAISNYNALIVSAQKRMSHNLSFLAGYRWSKCLDEVSADDFGSATFTSTTPSHDYGPCTYDHRNQLQASYTYELPNPHVLGFVGREFLGGWSTSGILTLRSGLPFSVVSGADHSTSGIGADRADLVGNPKLPNGRSRAQTLHEYFNTQAFALNALGTFGNSGRDFLVGPHLSNLDFTVMKSFPMIKEQRLEFRADFFNGLNFVNFNNPGANFSTASTFGVISSSGSARIIQLALKYHF
jgi:Carboxypeptidase regulatory-like domain